MNTHNKREILHRLTTTYQQVSQCMREGHFLSLAELLSGVQDVRAAVERELPEERKEYYTDILDGCLSRCQDARKVMAKKTLAYPRVLQNASMS